MNTDDNLGKSQARNVTAKDLVFVSGLVGVLLVLFYYREAGNGIAAFDIFLLLAIGHIAAYMVLKKAKSGVNEETNNDIGT